MAARLLSQSPQASPSTVKEGKKNEFYVPAVLKVPLVGTQIMDVESTATAFTKTTVETLKKKYTDFVETAVKTLKEHHSEPKNKAELKDLCAAACSIIWNNFNFGETNLLVFSVAKSRQSDGKLGALDCDSSSFVAADILEQFGVTARLVGLSDHTLLHLKSPGVSMYLETTDRHLEKGGGFYGSQEELQKHYQYIYGECDFSPKNYITYENRGNFRYLSRDYKGALGDYNEAITLNPKDADTYYNRGLANFALELYTDAARDMSKALEINPDMVSAKKRRAEILEKKPWLFFY